MDHVRDESRAGVARVRLGVLSERDLDDLNEATLRVLEQTGVWVEDAEALDVFADAGCAVDRDARSVRIPPAVVDAAIGSAPAEWRQCGRDPGRDVLLGGDRVTFTNFCEGLFMIDPRSGERRPATTQDVEDTARLSDRLGMIDAYMVAVTASDAPRATASLHGLRAAFRGTSKHIVAGATNAFECEASIDMAAAIVGGRDRLRERPIIEFGGCPVSPLRLPRELTEVAITAARNGIPLGACSMVMAGASAPVTLAGALVTHNAEVLATLVLVQSVERGSPFRASSSSTGMDLRVGTCPVGSPECAMLNVGVAQLARRYNLPSLVAGLQADSKTCDAQAGHEKTLTGVMTALAGANQIYGAGMVESGVTFDLGQLVVDDEIARMIRHILEEIPIAEDTLLLDDIQDVGWSGEFMSRESTLLGMRAMSAPRLFDRGVYEAWDAAGRVDLARRARDKALELLAEDGGGELPSDVAAELDVILARADRAVTPPAGPGG